MWWALRKDNWYRTIAAKTRFEIAKIELSPRRELNFQFFRKNYTGVDLKYELERKSIGIPVGIGESVTWGGGDTVSGGSI